MVSLYIYEHAPMENWSRNVQQIKPTVAVLSWCPPPPGQYKLNSNAAVFGDEFELGAVCQDSDGRIRFAAGCRVYGNGDVVLAEALASRWGVQLAHRLGFHDLIVEVDSAIVSQKADKA